LEAMVTLMNLQTGWAFLLPSEEDPNQPQREFSVRDFHLATACGLPPGLESQDRYHLRDPDGCHCQGMVTEGMAKRAVNIVECTRLRKSAAAQGDNQGLLFHASVPIKASGRPLGIINVATHEWQFLTAADLQLLSAIGAQVGIALERARLFDLTTTQRQRLERELQMARQMQESLLPEALPHIPGFSLAAEWQSALEMAGDFYDVFALPDNRWGMVIADVSDKGAAAAMYMAMTRSLIRASAASHTSPAETLTEVNQRLMAHSSSVMFVTMFYAILDPATRTLTYANAGQNPPLLKRASGELMSLTPTGPALGIFDHASLSDVSLTLAAGDALVSYTDGLTDALDPLGERYGVARLTQVIARAPHRPSASNLLDHLLKDHVAFTQGMPPFDDVTLLILASDE